MPSRYLKLILILLIGVVAWKIPEPQGISTQGWHLLILFVLTIVGVVVKPFPMGAIAFLSMAIGCLTHVFTMAECLDVYGKPIVWLVVFSFFIARGFTSTGLGSRIAYFFTGLFGRSVLGLSYGFVFTDFILAPAIPSNTARGAGIIFPIMKSLSDEFEGAALETPTSKKKHRKIGAFLIKVGFQANVITSAMFLTALAGNPLAAAFAEARGVDLSWMNWALAALVPGLICLVGMPLLIHAVYPPSTRKLPNARAFAKERLREMGKMSIQQIIMLVTFLGLLFLWMAGDTIGVNATLAGLIGIVVLLVGGVLDWEDVVKEHNAWGTFIWFGALIMLATQLEKSGVITWFGGEISHHITGMPWIWAFGTVTLVYFYSHYFFASTTALVTTMFTIFLQVLQQSGASPFASAMMLAGFGCLSSCLTHYGTGPAPVYFGAGYVSMRDWWLLGLLLSVFYIAVWWFVGFPWWVFLGLA